MADKNRNKSRKAAPTSRPPLVPVIGIGASSASFSSLERLVSRLPRTSGAAFVAVLQHKGGFDQTHILDRLRPLTGLTVEFASGKMPLQPDRILVASTNMLVTVEDGVVHVEPATAPSVERGSLDSFLVSLAQTHREKAIGVVLSGLGDDGTLGVTALKECGGLAVVEADEYSGNGGPASVAAVIADFVLPADRLSERISAYLRYLDQIDTTKHFESLEEQAAAYLSRVATVLRNKTGHDFHGYKQNTFLRRIQRRMQVVQIAEIENYVEYLKDQPDEAGHLFQDLLIGVTQFFRDPTEFELLKSEVIPRMFESRGVGDQVRIWVLGCATGEEAYSLAILLREHMAKLETMPSVQIFATDIDGRALASARVGRYSLAIANDVSPERLARWFVREGNTYCVVKELREMCIFSSHNVIKDAPFSRIDLISCRNLLIYLNADLQNRVIPLFHFALRPGGHLFLGPSENVTRHPKLFTPIDRRARIFRRQETLSRVLPDFPLTAGGDRRLEAEAPQTSRTRVPEGGIARRAERIAERYVPAYVIVDQNYEILHFSGRTGRFLEPSTGAATLNLLNLIHRDLRLDLRAGLQKAGAEREVVKLERVGMGTAESDGMAVNITIEPTGGEPDEPLTFVVLFQDGGRVEQEGPAQAGNVALLRDEQVQRLDAELRVTKDRLQETIEELESTNEELKSSNEEYQSINEELQSANEELETSKEELQSVNEELQTVNGELAHRVHDLARTNSDLKNLLESTQIATIFLDNDLRIKNYTPTIADVFHVIETDIGRPIGHITSRITYPELEEDVRRVLRTLAAAEREVEDPSGGSRYLVRVLPYRSIDNFIAGTVLTFLDITATTRAEGALRESEERFRMMAQTVPAFLFTAQTDVGIDYVNPRFYEYTGLSEGSALGDGWLLAVHPDDIEENLKRWREAVETGEPVEQEYRIRAASGSYRWVLGRAQPQKDAEGRIVKWYGSATDIHERKLAEGRQRLLLAELQHRAKNILAVVRSMATRTLETSSTLEQFSDHFGGRLSALARTQGVLARKPEGGIELEDLLLEEFVSHAVRDGEQVSVSGPPIVLREKAAEALGLAVHELATNAVKYGALATPNGRINVSWRVYDTVAGPRLSLEWQERGVKLDQAVILRNGFGRDLIENGLPFDLGATTVHELAEGGVRCVIELPLTDRIAIVPPAETPVVERLP